MRRVSNNIALLVWVSIAIAPAVHASEASVPATISWAELFTMQSVRADASLAHDQRLREPRLRSETVKPSSGESKSPEIGFSSIPDSEIWIPKTQARGDRTASSVALQSSDNYQAIFNPDYIELDLNVPSATQVADAAINLMGSSSALPPPTPSASIVRNLPTRESAMSSSHTSKPMTDANYSVDSRAEIDPLQFVSGIEKNLSRDGTRFEVAPVRSRGSRLPASSQSSESSLQNIGSYSSATDPVERMLTQLALDDSHDSTIAAEIDRTSLDSNDSPATSFELEFSKQLLGLYVDGDEHPALIAAHDGNEYLLPLVTILASSGASLDSNDDQTGSAEIHVNTPGGAAVLKEEDIRLVDGQLMITQTALAEKLLIQTRFDQSSFALYLMLPWSIGSESEFLAFTAPEPDFMPPSASVRNMRADLFYASTNAGTAVSGDYFLAGNLAGGGWRMRAEQHGDNGTTPSEYYWTKDWGKSVLLAGNSNYSLHPLLSTVEQTGVQYLYSTAALPTSRGVDITGTNGSKRIANGIRNISGQSSPGAVAELRIDGRVETRTRVRLDGSYDFPDVELPTRGYSEVLVHILENNTGALIETQDFSRRSGIELLSGGQHTLFSAMGQQGNLLDEQRKSLGASGAVQWRHGLTEDLTLELGSQQIGDQIESEAALSMAISNHWFASLAVADGASRNSLGFDIEGGSNNWNLDLTMREFSMKRLDSTPALLDQDYTLDLADLVTSQQQIDTKQWAHSFNFRYQLNENLTLGLIGRDTNTSYEQTDFVLPSASWSNRKNLSISARPNSEGNYRVDSRFTPSQYSSLRYAYEDQRHLFDYRHRSRSGREYYASYNTDEDTGGRLETGFVSRFDNERFGTLQMGLVNGESGVGYSLEWEATFVPGINSQLRLSKGNRELTLSDSDSDLFLQWHVTFDFAVAQKRIVAADSGSSATQSAALTGNLMLGDSKIPAKYDIDRIELLIDGDTYTAKVQGGRYYIEGLQPGLHKVAIDANFLPMELSPLEGQSFWVRLEKSAATEVPLGLEVKYSIAGRVRDANGENVAYQRLVILDDAHNVLSEIYTDQFGLYRTNNLEPGTYTVFADRNGDGDAVLEVVVSDSYLFEQNLTVATLNRSVLGDS